MKFVEDGSRPIPKTCGHPSCKAEQKRRNQAAWSKKNPSYWTERRLEKQLQQNVLQTLDGIRKTDGQPGYNQIPLIQMQEAIGKEHLVIVLFLIRILLRMHQDALSAKVFEFKGEMDRIRMSQAQEAMAKARDGP